MHQGILQIDRSGGMSLFSLVLSLSVMVANLPTVYPMSGKCEWSATDQTQTPDPKSQRLKLSSPSPCITFFNAFPHHISRRSYWSYSYLRSSERRRDPSPRSRSPDCRRLRVELEFLDPPLDTRIGWCSGRLSSLSEDFFVRAAACFSHTSLDLQQMSSICA